MNSVTQSAQYVMLIDGHALIYRAYHAFPGLMAPDGRLVNAVYGFTRILLAAVNDFKPPYIAVTFDHKSPTFRHADFVEYKAHRAAMPDDLIPQIELVKQVVTSLNMPQFELAGYEADDLIGTLARIAGEKPNLMTMIVTGDRDAFQLVNDVTHVWMPGRAKGQPDTEYDREGVKAKMGVYPEQIVDLKALMGDASDNIPGVPGIGEKTAVKLIQAFSDLQTLYQQVELVASRDGESDASTTLLKGAVLTKLKNGYDSAVLSQKLATINQHVPIDLDVEACRVSSYDKTQATEIFTELGFKSLVSFLPADEFELGIQNALF